MGTSRERWPNPPFQATAKSGPHLNGIAFGVKNMRHPLPVLAVSAFLAIAGIYHLLAPGQSERVFSKSGPVRIVGITLSVLGIWCLSAPERISHLIAIPILLSGAARFLFPGRMIEVNTWTSRYVHGVLMLLGAIGCALL